MHPKNGCIFVWINIYKKNLGVKKIIRLTESELKNIIETSVKRILREDDNSILNNYEPFESQKERFEQEDEFKNNYDWSEEGEEFDPTEINPEDYQTYDIDWDLSDGDLYRGTY